MSEEKASALDILTKIAALIGMVLGSYTAYNTFLINGKQTDLEMRLKQNDADLKNVESSRQITMDVYKEVRDVIAKENPKKSEENAVYVLVSALTEDPFKTKLLEVIAGGAKDKDVKEKASESALFQKEHPASNSPAISRLQTDNQNIAIQEQMAQMQQQRQTNEPVINNGAAPQASGQGIKDNVDVFYCELKKETSKPIAERLLTMQSALDAGRWRIRMLPESVNLKRPGYGITSSQIRFNQPIEEATVNAIEAAMPEVKFTRTPIEYQTPNYVSVFICE